MRLVNSLLSPPSQGSPSSLISFPPPRSHGSIAIRFAKFNTLPLYLAEPIPGVNSDCGDGAKRRERRREQEKIAKGQDRGDPLISPSFFSSRFLTSRHTRLL